MWHVRCSGRQAQHVVGSFRRLVRTVLLLQVDNAGDVSAEVGGESQWFVLPDPRLLQQCVLPELLISGSTNRSGERQNTKERGCAGEKQREAKEGEES